MSLRSVSPERAAIHSERPITILTGEVYTMTDNAATNSPPANMHGETVGGKDAPVTPLELAPSK